MNSVGEINATPFRDDPTNPYVGESLLEMYFMRPAPFGELAEEKPTPFC
jgi:hypothetical protein